MGAIHRITVLTLAVSLLLPAAGNNAVAQTGADQAIVLFQRAADAYAFAHRQAERRGTTPATLVEGGFFTPLAAAEFRTRIRIATMRGGCDQPDATREDFVVPRVNASAVGAIALPSCIAAALPTLPPELEYRSAGVALVLADAHLHIVVDVLHAAFPGRDE